MVSKWTKGPLPSVPTRGALLSHVLVVVSSSALGPFPLRSTLREVLFFLFRPFIFPGGTAVVASLHTNRWRSL